VLFELSSSAEGDLATDVRDEVDESSGLASGEPAVGAVKSFSPQRGFGFIRLDNGLEVFFHVSNCLNSQALPVVGNRVSCRLVKTQRGFAAREIDFDGNAAGVEGESWLARAIIAREAKRLDDAAKLYEQGMRAAPSHQLVLSYAAMEKNRGRKQAAMRVYTEGIKIFPRLAKLREDAGVLAESLGDHEQAVQLLTESLELIRRLGQGGEKGVLLELARTKYRIGREASLRDCVEHYKAATALFGQQENALPKLHALLMNLAMIRLQHHRGRLAVEFLNRSGFEIVRARLHEQHSEAAEFVVRVDDSEFKESYGLGQYLFVRCMFKADVELSDLNTIEASANSWADSGLGDDQVAVLIVSSLPLELKGLLSKRIEERGVSRLAVVPLQQSEIETSTDSAATLRTVLDNWLFRRDLFARNAAVQGSRFFGRANLLAGIREAILTSTPLGIFGLRKVGKTSLLLESQRRASEMGDLVVYVDLESTPTDAGGCRGLYWKIATKLREECERRELRGIEWELAGQFKNFLRIPADFPVATAFDTDLRSLLQFTRELHVQPRPRVVLLLDEMEFILPNPSAKKDGLAGYIEFLAHLRGVSQECKEFVFMVTAANPAVSETSQFEYRDNPVFNFFRETYLQLLEMPECATMMKDLGRGMGIRFAPDAIEYIFALTGGHPFFVRQVCSFTANQNRERPLTITEAMVRAIEENYLEQHGSKDLTEILDRLRRDFPEELEVCIALAVAGGAMPLADVRAMAKSSGATLRHLTGYQIARIDDGKLHLTMTLMAKWLKRGYASDA
jgi:tetratricopeptide (TPR) repeat protein